MRKHIPNFGLTVWRIETGDVSRPILAVFGFWRCFSVGEIIFLAALVECILVVSFALSNDSLSEEVSERFLFMDSGMFF